MFLLLEVPEGSNSAVVSPAPEKPKEGSLWRYYAGDILIGFTIAAVFFSSRTRKTVKRRMDYTQENLRNARALVKLFRQQKAELKVKTGIKKPKTNKST